MSSPPKKRFRYEYMKADRTWVRGTVQMDTYNEAALHVRRKPRFWRLLSLEEYKPRMTGQKPWSTS